MVSEKLDVIVPHPQLLSKFFIFDYQQFECDMRRWNFMTFILHDVLWVSLIYDLMSDLKLGKFFVIIASNILFSIFPSGIPITIM